jgi:hypothetical protein
MTDIKKTVDEIISAHGGMDLWNKVEEINVSARTGGLLPLTKLKYSALSKINFSVFPKKIQTVFHDFPEIGSKGVFDNGYVYIENGTGEIEDEREHPRTYFNRISKKLYWDYLDTIYFAGYAAWNYLCTPFMFKLSGFQFHEEEPYIENNEEFKRIMVIFPDTIDTHCKEQIFYFDNFNLIRRLDYTAEVIGNWAHGAHYCYDYVKYNGISFPALRRVFMRKSDGSHLEHPVIIWIKIFKIGIN